MGRIRDRNSRDRDSNMSSASGSMLIHASMAEVKNVSVVRMVKAKEAGYGRYKCGDKWEWKWKWEQNVTWDGNGQESRARRTSVDSQDKGNVESKGQVGSGSLARHSVAMRIAEDGES